MSKMLYVMVAVLAVLLLIPIYLVVRTLLPDSRPGISVVVAPHHDIVADRRLELFKAVAERQLKIKRIILLSPNHYDAGSQSIHVRSKVLRSEFGEIPIDTALLEAARAHGATINNEVFSNEHGIRLLLPDIKRAFPDAKILPVVINVTISQKLLLDFIDNLHADCSDCLLIASADMSHYQPYELSELHDQLTIRAFRLLDEVLMYKKAEVGPPHISLAAIHWAKLSGTKNFNLFDHTNSLQIEGSYYAEGTTHVLGWYESGAMVAPPSHVSFTFAGDMMFDRAIAGRYRDDLRDVFGRLGDRVLWGTDVVAANLEGPITDAKRLEQISDIPRFRFSPDAANALRFLRISALNLQNNHTLDTGDAGLKDTVKILNNYGIEAITDSYQPNVVAGAGLDIATFMVSQLEVDDGQLIRAVQSYANRTNTRVVVYIHWGPENVRYHGANQAALAHRLVEAGARLVIGTGPHVIQDAEVYKNVPIFYSLGNFLFDQIEDQVTSQSIILSGEFTNDTLAIYPMLSRQQGLEPVLQRSYAAEQKILQLFRGLNDYQVDSLGGLKLEFTQE